jgi:opacity protein-like surface antigen
MQRKLGMAIALGAVALFVVPKPGTAQEGWFVKLGTGVAIAREANIGSVATRNLGYESDKVGNTVAMNFAVGKAVSKSLGIDVGLSYHPDFGIDEEFDAVSVKSEIQSMNLMANMFYGLKPGAKVQPYLGAGAGLARTKVFDVINVAKIGPAAGLAVVDCKWAADYQPCEGDVSSSFAWQGMVGLGFQLKSDLMLDVSYRYRDLGDVTMKATKNGQVPQGQLRAHEPMIALKYLFGKAPVTSAAR